MATDGLLALFTKGAGSVTARTQRSINWALVGLLLTLGLAMIADRLAMSERIAQKADNAELRALDSRVRLNAERYGATEERLANMESMLYETRTDIKQILKEMK